MTGYGPGMSEVVGVVHVRAAEGRVDEVVTAFTTCLIKTHEEEGCLTYALHRDASDPNHLVLVERWRSQSDLDAHMTQPHVADLFAAVGAPGLLAAAPEITFLSPLGIGTETKGTLG
ncbi:MAG: putative monooxygenase [Frankiales bacterium]|nr:putative monooxygenase [Frankiales bacterium]